MTSSELLSVLNMSQLYKQRPSEFIPGLDEYTAFCFDEACSYILGNIKQGKEPKWLDKKKEEKIEDGLQYLLSLQKNL